VQSRVTWVTPVFVHFVHMSQPHERRGGRWSVGVLNSSHHQRVISSGSPGMCVDLMCNVHDVRAHVAHATAYSCATGSLTLRPPPPDSHRLPSFRTPPLWKKQWCQLSRRCRQMKNGVWVAVAIALVCVIVTQRGNINQQLAAVFCKKGETMDCELLRMLSHSLPLP